MGDVTFLGMGLMGRALAKTAIKNGYSTVVWNRSNSSAKELIADGAHFEPQLPDAIAQSSIVIVCVSDYEVTNSILRNEATLHQLNGRVLVQLSSGSPAQATESQKYFTGYGINYLDGAIMSAPSQIGTSDSPFFLTGNTQAQHRGTDSCSKAKYPVTLRSYPVSGETHPARGRLTSNN